MAEIRCPMCGHKNPDGTLNCIKCDARLVPMGSIGQSSSSIDEIKMIEQDDLASLLDDIVDDSTSEGTGTLDSDILTWLDDDQPERQGEIPEPGDTPPAEIQGVEDRLSDLLNNIEPPIDEKSLTDWLESTTDEAESVSEEADEDWLLAANEDLGETQDSAEDNLLPSWMEDTIIPESSTVEVVPVSETEDSGDNLPDWMSDTITNVSQYLEEETTPIENGEVDSPELPDWIVDAPRATTGELDSSVLDGEEQELPDWFTQELDDSSVEEEPESSTGSLTPRVSTGALPWMDGVSDDEDEPQFISPEPTPSSPRGPITPPEKSPISGILDKDHVNTGMLPWMDGVSADDDFPAEEQKKQIFITGDLDTSAVDEPPRESLKPDDKLPASSGILDGERVSTGSLPWMDGVSEPIDEEDESDFDLPVSKSLAQEKDDKPKRSGFLKKVTTSMLPWVSGVSDEKDKPKVEKEESIPHAKSTILERFSGTLGLKSTAKPVEEPVVKPELVEEPVSEDLQPEQVEIEQEDTQPEVEAFAETQFEEKVPEVEEGEEDVPVPDSAIPGIPIVEIPDTVEVESRDLSEPMSIDELVREEKIQTIAPQPKENYADALPEKEEGADSWSDYLVSGEFAPPPDELPEWFAQTTGEKNPSELLEEIGADENPTPVPVEEPEEKPTKKRGLTLGFLKGIRRRTDENLADKAGKEEDEDAEEKSSPTVPEKSQSVSFDDALEDINEDWDLAELLTDSSPLDEDTSMEEDVSEDIVKEDWVIEELQDIDDVHPEAEDESFVESLDETIEEMSDVEEEEVLPQSEQASKPTLVEKTANLSGGTDSLENSDLDPEDEALIGFAGTSDLPSWMVGSGKQEHRTTDLLDAALGDQEEAPHMTAGLPDWMNTGQLPSQEDLTFEVDDELMESIQEAVPTSELPTWLAEAEDQTSAEALKAEQPEAHEEPSVDEPSVDEPSVDEPEIFTGMFVTGVASDEEMEDEIDALLEGIDVDTDEPNADLEVAPITTEKESSDITGSITGLPEWLDDDIEFEEDSDTEDDLDEADIQKERRPQAQGLPEFMDDNMEFISFQDKVTNEEDAGDDDSDVEEIATAVLPDWMDDETGREEALEIDSAAEKTSEEDDGTAILPDWMADEAVESEEDFEIASEFVIEDDLVMDESIIETVEQTVDDDAEAFIAGLEEESEAVVEEVSEEPLPEWLDELAEDEEVKAGTSALEDWMADPTSTNGMTGMLLDGLETGTLPPLDEDEEDDDDTAILPDWMSDSSEDESGAETSIDDVLLENEDATAVLPEWMSELAEQASLDQSDTIDQEVPVKKDTSALEDWMKDPTKTRGLTGMLLDGLDTGTLPPLEDFDEGDIPEEFEDISEGELAGKKGTSVLDDWMDDPEATRGSTGMLLDSLATGTLPPLDDEEDSAVIADDLPDWMSDMEIESADGEGEDSFLDEFESVSDALSKAPTDLDDDVPVPEALTVALGDIAATHALPDWLSQMTIEEEDEESAEVASEDFSVDLADFTSSDAELPDWMDDIAADEPPEAISKETEDEQPDFESIFDSEVTSDQEQTAVLPEWVNDMESAHGHTGMLIDGLETEDTRTLKQPGSTSELPDWLSEYGTDEESAAPEGEADELDDWLIAQDEEDEIPDLFAFDDTQSDELEPIIVTDTGELNTWIEQNGIQPDELDADETEIEDVIPIDVQKDLPDWVLDLEPDETAPMAPEIVVGGTAALPEWITSEQEPEIDHTLEEIPPMEKGMFDFMSGEEHADSSTDAFDLSSFEAGFSDEDLFEEPTTEPGEEVTEADLFDVSTDFVADDFSMDSADDTVEVSPFDIRALEDVQENYTPAMELADQSEWLGEYAEEESHFEEGPDSASPFSVSVEDANAEGIAVAEDLPDWVDEIDTADEDIWEKPLAAMAAISSSVQSSFDIDQPDIDHERANIQLMERILLSEKGSVQAVRPRRRTRDLTLRLMLTVMLFVAVIAGLYSVLPPLPNFINNAPAAVVQFEQEVRNYQQTASGKPVLLVFDYQPAYHGEMSVYAELPLKSLMENNARIFTFSTVPEGPTLSQKMLFDIVIQNGLVYNTQSQAVPLGYLPGGNAAIRDFALNMRSTVHGLDVGSSGTYVWDLPMTSDVDSLDDFAMVIVLTDDLDKARVWVEQATLYLPETTQTMMVASARISPMLKPYLLSEQLDGLIGSPVDTAAYGTVANQVGSFLYYWRAYQLGIYLMVFTIIAGAVLQILRQLQRALPKRGDS